MKRTLKGLAFTVMIALSLLASAGNASATDAKHGRETAWTEAPLPPPHGVPWANIVERLGVTWEE